MADLVVTKLEPPRISPGTVTRSRLIRRMGRFDDGKATFLVAPAGYGKTTLLLQLSQAVSYTHLDVYKRQHTYSSLSTLRASGSCMYSITRPSRCGLPSDSRLTRSTPEPPSSMFFSSVCPLTTSTFRNSLLAYPSRCV